MSVAARFEVFVYLDRFRNVDLFHQGEYAVRLRVYTEKSKVVGIPVSYIGPPHPKWPAGLVSGGLDEDDASFCCSSFYIRYREEQQQISEGAVFALELDVSPDFIFEPVVLQFELLFKKPNKAAQGHDRPSSPSSPTNDLHQESTHAFRFHPSARGVHSYCHLTFEELHTCGIEAAVHLSMLFFTLKRPSALDKPDKKAKKTKGKAGEVTGAHISSKHKVHKLVKPTWAPSSFADMLFPPPSLADVDPATPSIDTSLDRLSRPKPISIDFLHRCLAMLSGSYQEMSNQFLQFAPLCEDRGMRDRLEEALHMPTQRGISRSEVSAESADHVLLALGEDFSAVAHQVMQMWNQFLSSYSSCAKGIIRLLRRRSEDSNFLRWTSCVYVDTITPAETTVPAVDSTQSVRAHHAIVHRLRKSPDFCNMKTLPLEDLTFMVNAHNRPILFEQRCLFQRPEDGAAEARAVGLDDVETGFGETGTHFFVMVHGFQGNQYDLRMFKNHLSYLYPDAEFIMSSCNEADTYADIEHMGLNLGREVDRAIQSSMLQVGRISFVGHSMGALVTRACLTSPPMQQYLSKLHTFVSLSGAHLGYLYSENTLLDSGMWFLKKWKNSAALHQLSLTDASGNPRASYLYRLSEGKGLQYFRNVLLVSSPQDGYAPFYSSRMEVCPEALHDSKHGSLHLAMVNNLLRPLHNTQLVRYEVFFNIHGRGLDNAIKRAAHIMFLENIPFIHMFIGLNRRFFD